MRLTLPHHVVALVLAGCNKPEAQPARPEPAPSVAVSQATSEAPLPEATERGADPERRAGEAVLFGTLHRLGTKRCTSRDTSEWDDVHLRAGFVRLTGDTKSIRDLVDEPVLVFGSVGAAGRPQLPRTSSTCPPFQSRSDWIDSPDGILLRRDDGAEISEFRVRAGRQFDGISARREGADVVLELANPLGEALETATLTVHYEGCYGKPLTHREPHDLGRVGASEKKSARALAEARVTKGNRSDLLHVARSVQLTGRAPDVYFDLDVRLETLGVDVECPDRKR